MALLCRRKRPKETEELDTVCPPLPLTLCVPSSPLTLTVCRPQIIQRQLEQVEEKQRQLEERGVAVEKALRGEAGTTGPRGQGPRESPVPPTTGG